jgi:hypothetical protein
MPATPTATAAASTLRRGDLIEHDDVLWEVRNSRSDGEVVTLVLDDTPNPHRVTHWRPGSLVPVASRTRTVR